MSLIIIASLWKYRRIALLSPASQPTAVSAERRGKGEGLGLFPPSSGLGPGSAELNRRGLKGSKPQDLCCSSNKIHWDICYRGS